jgi:hypothetical protein
VNWNKFTVVESSRRAPCIHARLRCLATKPREKYGLARRRAASEQSDCARISK